jgi:hypothetical protein
MQFRRGIPLIKCQKRQKGPGVSDISGHFMIPRPGKSLHHPQCISIQIDKKKPSVKRTFPQTLQTYIHPHSGLQILFLPCRMGSASSSVVIPGLRNTFSLRISGTGSICPPFLFKFGLGAWVGKVVTLGCCGREKPSGTSYNALRDGYLSILVSHIYGCRRIYLKVGWIWDWIREWKLVLARRG